MFKQSFSAALFVCAMVATLSCADAQVPKGEGVT